MYAVGVAFLPFFIHFASDVKPFFFLSLARVYYIRCLFAWNVVQDVPLAEHDQCFVYLLTVQSGTDAEGFLVDVCVVGEQTGVRT